jgi:probable F420-dependent oxidoreductase
MKTIRVGVQLEPQHTNYAAYAQAVRQVEALGVDTLWNWDHFFPPWEDVPPVGNPTDPFRGNHFEAWTLLTAMASLTQRAEVGCLVTCNSYRNPALLSNMAKTVDHISGGRLILGMGAGWREAEYQQYGYQFGTATQRLQSLETALVLIKQRWAVDLPLPVRQPIPIMIGGDGEKVTLRLVAQYADQWNTAVSPEQFQHKCTVLDQWCANVGRDPAAIERSVSLHGAPEASFYDEYVAAGAQHFILNLGEPWDLAPVEHLIRWREWR